MSAVRARGLEKRYGALAAVRGIDLDVDEGEIFGLIGPDGAGKTSTFHVLSGVMEPTAGEIEIFGRPPREARAQVGYLTQAFSLYPDLSVWENIRYVGQMREISDADIKRQALHYLGLFDMDRFTERLAGRLSGGMKQKLALTCALISAPRLLLLDEPTTGVDPVSRREFWDTLAHLAADGMSIVVATPYLDEAERCGRVSLMHEGTMRETGTPSALRSGLGLHRVEVRTPDLRSAEAALQAAPDSAAGPRVIEDVQRFGDRLDVMVADAAIGIATIERLLPAATEVRAAEPTLENVFVAALRTRTDDAVLPPSSAPRQSGAAIRAERLRKTFGTFVAVDGVDLEVRYGEIYGLLGANGAGKTTTIKMLCGLLDATDGHLLLAGARDGQARASAVRQRVGYMSQKFSLYDDLTIAENLDFYAGVYGVDAATARLRQQWVLDFANLAERRAMLTGDLPGGWKQRVAFGAAIMHDPQVVFLDEPTSGVDPMARRAFWRIINQLADRGVAILITTHYLEEAEQCNRLGLMVAGEVVAQGTPSELKHAQRGHVLSLATDRPQAAADLLRTTIERWRVSLFGDRLHVVVDEPPQQGIERLRALLTPAGIAITRADEERWSLEDVFIATVEQARKAGKAVTDE